MSQAQTRTRVYANVAFAPSMEAKTRFVKIQKPKKPAYFRLVIQGVGNAFIRPTEDGRYQAMVRSTPMVGIEGKTPEAVWAKLAKSIGSSGVFPELEESAPATRAPRQPKATKPAAKKAKAAAKPAAKKAKVAAKTSKKAKTNHSEEFDFESMSSNM